MIEKYWEIEAKLAKQNKELQKKWPLLNRKVRRRGRSKWEEGTIVLDKFDDSVEEYFIEFEVDDKEQLIGLPFQIWETEQWVDGWDYFNEMGYKL